MILSVSNGKNGGLPYRTGDYIKLGLVNGPYMCGVEVYGYMEYGVIIVDGSDKLTLIKVTR